MSTLILIGQYDGSVDGSSIRRYLLYISVCCLSDCMDSLVGETNNKQTVDNTLRTAISQVRSVLKPQRSSFVVLLYLERVYHAVWCMLFD